MKGIHALLLSFPLLAAACGGVASPSENRVTTFQGTIPVGGQGATHTFNADKNGEMSVRLTAISPTQAAILGAQLLQSIGGTCNSIYGSDNFVGLNRDVLQGGVQKGTYCLIMFDAGTLIQAQTYTVQVSHP